MHAISGSHGDTVDRSVVTALGGEMLTEIDQRHPLRILRGHLSGYTVECRHPLRFGRAVRRWPERGHELCSRPVHERHCGDRHASAEAGQDTHGGFHLLLVVGIEGSLSGESQLPSTRRLERSQGPTTRRERPGRSSLISA